MSAYFVWATFFNLHSRREHAAHFSSIGLPMPNTAFALGMTWQFAGGALLLFTPTAALGGVFLIAFTLMADVVYHRFWEISDPDERTRQKLIVYEHFAFCGGLIGLVAPNL
jgi:putative oxidoreductase